MRKKKPEISDAVGLTPSSIRINKERMRQLQAAMNRQNAQSAKQRDELVAQINAEPDAEKASQLVVNAARGKMIYMDFIHVQNAWFKKFRPSQPEFIIQNQTTKE